MSSMKAGCLAFLIVLLAATLTQQYTVTIDSTTCTTSSLVCVSSSSFVTCSIVNGEVLLSTTEYSCPTGYSCDDTSTTVCQATTTTAAATTTETTTTEATTTEATTTEATTTEATTTEATTTEATTTQATTTVASTTPTETTTLPTTTVTVETTTIYGEPTCNSTGNYPGPTCSEYYECVAVWWWFAAALRTCDTGLYYSKTNGTCVAEADSGCTE